MKKIDLQHFYGIILGLPINTCGKKLSDKSLVVGMGGIKVLSLSGSSCLATIVIIDHFVFALHPIF